MPELRSFNSLTLADFHDHPVWISVRSFDRGEPWFEEANEETFRFWDKELPFTNQHGITLVLATLEFEDGSVHQGFVCPAREDWDAPLPPRKIGDQLIQPASPSRRHGGSQLAILGIQQPRIFLGHETFGFWGGRQGIPDDLRKSFYKAARRTPEQIFPIQFRADHSLSSGILSGRLEGFYRSVSGNPPECSW
jgi:hypothetical protein